MSHRLLALLSCLGCLGMHAQSAPSTPTLQTAVQLVVEDVVVTDRQGVPVHGLGQVDFSVRENSAPQTLRGVEEHVGGRDKQVARQQLPPGVFSNVPVVEGVADVLLLDGMNTPPQSQPYLRDQLVKFLAAERPGTRIAVFTLNQSLQMLQSFTTDPELLKRVVKLQGVQFSPLLSRELNDTDAHKTSETLTGMIEKASDPGMARMLEDVQRGLLDMAARRSSQQVQVRARLTMDALMQMARYLAGVPGRKNLLWFSGSFPVSILRDIQTTGDPFAGQADLTAELQRTINLLAVDRVAVYPIDARGLEPPPSQGVEENGFTGDRQRAQRTYGTSAPDPRDSQFYLDQAMEHSTMLQLAQGTGGEAFYNTNGLQQAAERATTDGSNYYTLQYTPPPGGKPGELRRIEVRVNRPGVKLSYRRAYYSSNPTVATAASSISSAAVFRAPDASEIGFRLTPAAVGSAPPDKTVGLKAAGPDHGFYTLNLEVPLDMFTVQQSGDGKHRATLEFATLLYSPTGSILDSHQDRAALVMDDARYQAMVQAGSLRFHHTVALGVGSRGSVRVLVRDVSTNRVGSLRLTDEQIRQAGLAAKP